MLNQKLHVVSFGKQDENGELREEKILRKGKGGTTAGMVEFY